LEAGEGTIHTNTNHHSADAKHISNEHEVEDRFAVLIDICAQIPGRDKSDDEEGLDDGEANAYIH
jgi:hypothetical protein